MFCWLSNSWAIRLVCALSGSAENNKVQAASALKVGNVQITVVVGCCSRLTYLILVVV